MFFFFFNSLKAVDITSCGNFAVIGLSTGQVDVYNMQSGIHRGHYGEERGKNCHTTATAWCSVVLRSQLLR